MTAKKANVVVTRRLPDAVETRMRELFSTQLNLSDKPFTQPQLVEAVRTADVLVPTVSDKIDAHVIAQAGDQLKLIANFGNGTDNIDIEAASDRGITVTNTPRVLTDDTADMIMAMMLAVPRRLVEGAGVTVVATSNRHPDDLYKDGINRPLFLPFIDHLKTHCRILELASDRDYRLDRLIEAPVWYAPLGPEAETALEAAWDRLTLGAEPQHCVLTVKGRKLDVPREAAGVAWFSFEELCARPLGSRDYLAIAANFNTVILSGIPKLGPENRNEAARFVALIDAFYEARIKLVASAAAEPEHLYPEGDGSFEFERTASRLHEMRSTDYLAEARVEIDVDAPRD